MLLHCFSGLRTADAMRFQDWLPSIQKLLKFVAFSASTDAAKVIDRSRCMAACQSAKSPSVALLSFQVHVQQDR